MRNKWLNKAIKNNLFETILAILFKILFAGCLVVLSYSLSSLLDNYQKGASEFNKAVIIVVGILFITIVISFLSDVFLSRYIKKANLYVREKISEKITGDIKDLLFLKNTGKKLSWYVNDVDEIEEKYFSNLIDVFHYSAMVLAAFISVFMLHWSLALSALVLLILSLLIPNLLTKYIASAQKKLTSTKETYTENVRDNLESLNTLFISNNLDYFKKRMIIQDIIREDSNYKYNITIAKTSNIMIFISFLSQIGLTIISLYVSSLGYTSLGSVLSIAALSGNLFNGVQGLIKSISIFSSVNAITDKYLYEENQNKNYTIDKIDEITLKNISFSYEDRQIFRNFNKKLIKKKYALIGSSGSGKSTMLKIILGILRVDEGEVLVNDINLYDINYEFYFKNLAYIEQNVYLLNGSIKDNILLDNKIDADKLDDILKKSNLDTFIEKLPNGLDTVISSNGQEISGGEKQRIAIARALVKNVDFIFVDESTSQLDIDNRDEIEEILLGLKNVGLIMISHNFDQARLKKFDEIIEL